MGSRFIISVDNVAFKAEVSKALHSNVTHLVNNQHLKRELANTLAEIIKPYIPRSALTGVHHLQEAYVLDDTIRWSRYDTFGNNITQELYHNTKNRQWQIRSTGGNDFGVPHSPWHYQMPEWDKYALSLTQTQELWKQEAEKILQKYGGK